MAIVLVQSAGSTRSGNGTTHTQAFSGNIVSGNRLVVCATTWNRDCAAGSVTDSRGNTYTRQVFESTSGFVTSAIYTATAGSSGACTVTLTPSAATWMAMAIAEVSGTSAIGNSNHLAQNTTTPTSGDVSTSAEAILFGSLLSSLATTFTPGSGWTTIYQDPSATNLPNSHIYRIEAAAGTWPATWTLSVAGAQTAVALALTGSGGAVTMPRFIAHYKQQGIM